ncbi:MAG TPA: acyl-CoA thioester hydrolase/BAAT C-terminal domain-containing protein [Blastocatellia bacterium]
MNEIEEKDPTFKQPNRIVLSMSLLLACAFLCWMNGCKASSADASASLKGRWKGSATFRGQATPAILDFYETPGGWRALGGKAESPDYFFQPVRNIRYQHPRLSFEINDGPVHTSFEGTVSDKTIKVVSRGQEQVIFELQWMGDAPPPQYTEEAIELRNGEVKLGGDLLLPPGPGPHPAIVLIHGSGRGTRDSCRMFGNLFVANGVAALLYDKRDAVDYSTGMDLVTHHDLAGDVLAAVALLKARDDIRDDQIGLWGASQGSSVAAIVAAQSNDVAFMIEVSPSGVSLADLGIFYQESRLRSRGFSAREVSEATGALRRVHDFVRKGNPQGAQPILDEMRRKPWFRFSTLPYPAPTETELKTAIRWRDLDFDPVYYRERVKIPALIIFGELEDRAPPDLSAKRIREAFLRAGNTKYTIKIFPGADHSITLGTEVATNGGPLFAPGYLDTMTGWLREQLGPRR